MRFSLTYIDKETWMAHPRFWFRLLFSFILGVMNFLYAMDFQMDLLSPGDQRLGLEKLLIFMVGAVLVSECVFHVQKDLALWLKRKRQVGETALLAMGAGIIMSGVLMLLIAQTFEAVYREPIGFEYDRLVAFTLLSTTIIFSSVYLIITMIHGRKYPLEIFVKEVEGWTVLEVANIAHIVCYDKNFLFTYHSGARYIVNLEENLEEVYAMLHPRMFFMVNDQVVVSRRGCGQVLESKNGTVRILLRPKVKLPEHMNGKIDLEGME